MRKKGIHQDLHDLAERIFQQLQTTKARKALERAFRATPAELGRAALRAARKKKRR